MTELDLHWSLLVEAEMSRGAGEHHAQKEADRLLGSHPCLLERYAARPELRAWWSRWPALWFTVVPLATYLALSAATLALVCLIVELMTGYLHKIHIAPRMSQLIALSAHIVFLWIFPTLVATGFATLAYRRRVARRWPLAGMVLLSVIAALANVDLILTGGARPGSAGAGIGLSTKSLSEPIMRSVAVTLLALAMMRIAVRRFGRGGITD